MLVESSQYLTDKGMRLMEEHILQIMEICYCGKTLFYINELRLLQKKYIYLTHNDASLVE